MESFVTARHTGQIENGKHAKYSDKKKAFSGPHFRLPRFDSPLTTPSEVKINGRRILPVINYYLKNALFVKCLYPSLYPVV